MQHIGAIERVSIQARKSRDAEALWTAFLRKLVRRYLGSVKLVIAPCDRPHLRP
jgi:hypothetical protein